MSYIYFCKIKHKPNEGYIGQDSRDISSLSRIKEHIDAAYTEGSKWDGCAAVIRRHGCCAVEWSFFDQKQEYGLPQGVLQDFKKHWNINVGDLDLAEVLHIIGSNVTNSVSASYNKQIGGQKNMELIYKWPQNDKYGLALQQVFNNTKLPEIKITKFQPATSWQKLVYPGQYEILKQFTDNYIYKKFKNQEFLNTFYNKLQENTFFETIISLYIKQYTKQWLKGKKNIILSEDSEIEAAWKDFALDIEDDIQQTLWEQKDISAIIQSLRSYHIHINKGMFNWKILAKEIKKQLKEQLFKSKRGKDFIDLIKQELSKANNIKKINWNEVIKQTIYKTMHNYNKQEVALQIQNPSHYFFYSQNITPYKGTKPSWFILLENYQIKWGITPAQQEQIFNWSRKRLYACLDEIKYSSFLQIHHGESLQSRFRETPPISQIKFLDWERWSQEVLTAYMTIYKDKRYTPVIRRDGGLFRGSADDGHVQLATRDDLFSPGISTIQAYGRAIADRLLNPRDSKKYY